MTKDYETIIDDLYQKHIDICERLSIIFTKEKPVTEYLINNKKELIGVDNNIHCELIYENPYFNVFLCKTQDNSVIIPEHSHLISEIIILNKGKLIWLEENQIIENDNDSILIKRNTKHTFFVDSNTEFYVIFVPPISTKVVLE